MRRYLSKYTREDEEEQKAFIRELNHTEYKLRRKTRREINKKHKQDIEFREEGISRYLKKRDSN